MVAPIITTAKFAVLGLLPKLIKDYATAVVICDRRLRINN